MSHLSRLLSDDEYKALNWFDEIKGVEWDRYRWEAAERVLRLAKERAAAGSEAEGQALSLISGAISMQLRYGSPQPFGPMIQTAHGRSLSFEDLGEVDGEFLARLARDTEDPWLRARFADLSVSIGRASGEDWQLGRIAVDAYLQYLQAVMLSDRAIDGVDECRRALTLLWVYAKRDSALVDTYWGLIVDAVKHALERNWPGVAFPLCDEAMARNRDACAALAPLLQAKAGDVSAEQPDEAARYYDYAGRVWRRLRELVRAREAQLAQGEALVRVAEAAANGNPLAAPHWLLQALAVLRKARAPAARIAELRDQLTNYQLASLDAFRGHQVRVDVSEWVDLIHKEVHGPTFFEALLQMSFRVSSWLDFDECRQRVIDTSRTSVLASLFETHHSNEAGAVVATEPPLDTGNEASIFQKMVVQAKRADLALRAGVLVDHVTTILYSNYQVQFFTVKEIVDASPVTPADHSETIARGLYAGICEDWVASAVYLIPSVEPIVRTQLSRRGVHTTVIREDGTQQERTLSELLVMPEAETIFGKNLLFELRTLLTEPIGFNLRYCHGLLNDSGLNNPGVRSLWWTLWRMILFPWYEHPAAIGSGNRAPEGAENGAISCE